MSALDTTEDPPLYRIVYVDGDEEDMDRHEFEAAYLLAAQQKKGPKKRMKEEKNPKLTQKKIPKVTNWDDDDQVENYIAAKEEQKQTASANAEKNRLKAVPINAVHAEIVLNLSQVRAFIQGVFLRAL